ncbi:SfnB family sulfur acquisition oxidoreductase [Shimwellia pseudoproteus]|uniref:SfnB family sulfur acquisition oxidoreductase n=1 Tax=Shimwellia pseudoproteus TaxID=570012 RepID=UPI0018EB9AB0|nr:SfnB family sulfur acquisition oxidoreductase [Shimwellia pseudoproteus]MBJ3816141.1 SfnB family sulfur acquisition oxidoreductase [Shimwellia pseudoproteus]
MTTVIDAISPARVLTRPEDALREAHALAALARTGAVERDQQRRYAPELLAQFSASGLGSISVPRRFGGGGLGYSTVADILRIISAADPALGQIPQNHFALIHIILAAGSAEQQQILLSDIVQGQRLGNGGPEKNSRNTREILARLQPVNGELRLNGEKFYSTGALFADRVVITALDHHNTPVMVFIPRHSPGVTVVDDWSGMGQRTTASGTVRLENVRVTPGQVLPAPPADQPTLRGAVSQLIQAAIDAGIAQGALEDAGQFIQHSSRPWIDATEAGISRNADDPYLLADVGRLHTELSAALALLQRAAKIVDSVNQQPLNAQNTARASIAVAEAKVLTTAVALRASEKLLEWGGSRATLLRHGLDRHWRNARTHTLHDPVRWKHHAIGNYYLNGVFPARHAWI